MSDDDLTPEIREALQGLNVRAEAAARSVDARRVADGVAARLRAAPEQRRLNGGTNASARWIRRAAAVVLVAGGAVTAAVLTNAGAPASAALPVNIDSLSASDSQAIMIAVEQARTAPDSSIASSVVTVDDLNEQELRALLQALESEETL